MNATLVIASLLVLGTRQEAPPAVTFQTPGTPVTKALEGISKLAGVTLKAAPQTAPDILVLRFDKAPLNEVKEKIARAVSGKWETQTDGTELLVADENMRRDEQRAEDAEWQTGIQKGLKSMAKMLEPPKKREKTVVDGEEVQEEDYEPGAGEKLLARLVTSLRSSDIASLKPGDRVVFSTSPTAMQRAIRPAGLDLAVAEYVKYHNSIYGNKGSVEAAPEMEAGMSAEDRQQALDFMRKLGYEEPKMPTKIETGIAKVLLIIERFDSSRPDYVQVGFRLFDPAGKCLAAQQMPLRNYSYMAADVTPSTGVTEDQKEPTKPPVDPELNVPFKPNEEILELMKAANPMAADTNGISESLMAKLSKPDETDPLALITGPQLLAIAEAKKSNLAACVPDSTSENGPMAGPGGPGTLASAKEALERHTVWESANGWIVVRPDEPVQSRSRRLDRVALSRFLASCAGRETPSLDAIADYAAKNEPLAESPAAMPGVFFVCPGAIRVVMTYQSAWDMLRLYGLLSVGARQSLKQGQPVVVGSLGGAVAGQVKKMVFGTGASFTTAAQDPAQPRGFFMGMAMGMRGEGTIDDFREEPTELMPNGLPGNATLTLKITPAAFVSPTDSKGFFGKFMSGLGPEELGMLWSFSEMPNNGEFASMFPKATKFRVGTRQEMAFSINLVQGVRQIHMLQEDAMAKDAPEVSKDDLPKDFLDRAKMMADMMKKGFGQFMRGMPGETVPPR